MLLFHHLLRMPVALQPWSLSSNIASFLLSLPFSLPVNYCLRVCILGMYRKPFLQSIMKIVYPTLVFSTSILNFCSLPTQCPLIHFEITLRFQPTVKTKIRKCRPQKKEEWKYNPPAISGRSWPTAPALIGSRDKNELLANVNESVSGRGRECTHTQHTTKVVLEPVSSRAFLVDTAAKAGGCTAMLAVESSVSLFSFC